MNVIDQLECKQDFTDTEEALADYILTHVDDVCAMTIGSLSQVSHSSSASIVRLCRKLGLSGYRELRIELARELERSRTQLLSVNPDRPFIERSNTNDIASSILALSKQALDATYASLSMGTVRRAAQMLMAARRIVFYAVGDSCASAEAFSLLLHKIGLVCVTGMPKGDYGPMSRILNGRDVALVITYSGWLFKEHRKTFEILRSSGCKIIVVSADVSLRKQLLGTDCLLLLPQGETRSGRLASFYSQECIRYALNCLYAELFAVDYELNAKRWQDVQRALEQEE